jgi:hypothetical protein
MITLEEAMVDAAAQLDRLLEERWDAIALDMIAAGADPTDDGTHETDSSPGGDWERISFANALDRQKALDRQWRDALLERLRVSLIADLARRGAAPPSP